MCVWGGGGGDGFGGSGDGGRPPQGRVGSGGPAQGAREEGRRLPQPPLFCPPITPPSPLHTRAGKCFRMYSEAEFEGFRPFSLPEVQRIRLESVVLQVRGVWGGGGGGHSAGECGAAGEGCGGGGLDFSCTHTTEYVPVLPGVCTAAVNHTGCMAIGAFRTTLCALGLCPITCCTLVDIDVIPPLFCCRPLRPALAALPLYLPIPFAHSPPIQRHTSCPPSLCRSKH